MCVAVCVFTFYCSEFQITFFCTSANECESMSRITLLKRLFSLELQLLTETPPSHYGAKGARLIYCWQTISASCVIRIKFRVWSND